MASDKKTPAEKNQADGSTPKSLQDKANQVMDSALEGTANDGQPVLGADDVSVADKFKGLPMRDLIGGPLVAAAEAQQNLAGVAWDFYQKIAFESDGDGKNVTRVVDFKVNRPVEQDGRMVMVPQTVQAPFIGLVPIPSLLIDRIDIDFQMEVTDTNVEKTSSKSEASTEISGGWWVTKAEVSGKVTSARENTRTTNQTAKYQVHVTASQQSQTEGLSKLMDIMASCIEPVAVESK